MALDSYGCPRPRRTSAGPWVSACHDGPDPAGHRVVLTARDAFWGVAAPAAPILATLVLPSGHTVHVRERFTL